MLISDLGCFFSASDLTFCKLSHASSWTADLICKRNAQSRYHSSLFPSHSFFCHLFLFPLWYFPSSLILFWLIALYLQYFGFCTYINSLAAFPPLCWISATERKASSQQAITIEHSGRIAAERETSLKLETYHGGLVGFFKRKNWRTR